MALFGSKTVARRERPSASRCPPPFLGQVTVQRSTHMRQDEGPSPVANPIAQDPAREAPSRKCVYVVDDDRMARRSLSFALTTAGFYVRAFISGQDFLDELPLLEPGCVLLDLRMRGLDGIGVLDALGEAVRRFPVLIVTGHGDVGTVVKAMKRGARDCLEKPFTDRVLMDILATHFLGLSEEVDASAERSEAAKRFSRLTPRERDVLQGLLAGSPNKTIAQRLEVSVRTVEMHRSRLMERLGVKSLAEILQLADLASVPRLD